MIETTRIAAIHFFAAPEKNLLCVSLWKKSVCFICPLARTSFALIVYHIFSSFAIDKITKLFNLFLFNSEK